MLHIVFAVRLSKPRNGRLRSRPFILKGVTSPYAPAPLRPYAPTPLRPSTATPAWDRRSIGEVSLAQEPLRLQVNCQSIASLTDSTAS